VEAALLAGREAREHRGQAVKALELEIEAARYEANRFWRQYDAADPENRLVAGELERRWNAAMEKVQQLERRMEEARHQCGVEVPPPEAFQNLAKNIVAAWDDPRTDVRLKKRMVRTLIEEIIADVDAQASEVVLLIHWKGGIHTELRVPRRRAGQRRINVPTNVIDAVRMLARICSDDRIAAWLTRNGLHTSGGNCWTRQHVTGLRHRHDIPVYDAQRQSAEGWLNMTQAAAYLGIDRVTLRGAVEAGQISAVRPLPVGPWVFKRDDLDSSGARAVARRVQQRRQPPRREVPGQLTLDLSSTS
jgi:hypothetical protein